MGATYRIGQRPEQMGAPNFTRDVFFLRRGTRFNSRGILREINCYKQIVNELPTWRLFGRNRPPTQKG
jgi:hypothetical protein